MSKKALWGVMGGFAAGAAAMYFLDPDRGRRRRALATDKITSTIRHLSETASAARRDLSNRRHGLWLETKRIFAYDDSPDEVIEQRVRSKMGRVVSKPHSINVKCENGCVMLSGTAELSEMPALLRSVRAVPGVRQVENLLHSPPVQERQSFVEKGKEASRAQQPQTIH